MGLVVVVVVVVVGEGFSVFHFKTWAKPISGVLEYSLSHRVVVVSAVLLVDDHKSTLV